MKTRNLIGTVSQLTIFGQIEFIENNEYKASNKDGVIFVTGVFKIVGSEDTEQLQIEMTVDQYLKHTKG